MGIRVRRVVETKARGVVRRLRATYLDVRQPDAATVPDAPTPVAADFPALSPDGKVPGDEFHSILHTLRTAELRCVPKGARRVVSVGASGRWYFDWFEECVGPLELHVGVEAALREEIPEFESLRLV